MNIDGQALNYTGGNSSFQQFTWPGITGQGVTLTVKIQVGLNWDCPSYSGTWGVFHFFADADKTLAEWECLQRGVGPARRWGAPGDRSEWKARNRAVRPRHARSPSYFAEGLFLHVAVCIECGTLRQISWGGEGVLRLPIRFRLISLP